MRTLIQDFLDKIKEMLEQGCTKAFTEIIDALNELLGNSATSLQRSPSAFNGNIFSMIQNVNNTIILPIAGIIMTYVLAHDIIIIINERNNTGETDHVLLLKWVFKAFITIMLVSNAWRIIIGLFDVGVEVVGSFMGYGYGTSISQALTPPDFSTYNIGQLLILLIESFIYKIVIFGAGVAVSVFVVFRFVEIYCYSSLAAIPFSMWGNRELSNVSLGYLKTMLGLAFQALLMIIVIAMFVIFIAGSLSGDVLANFKWILVYVAVLVVGLKQAGSIAKNVFTGA